MTLKATHDARPVGYWRYRDDYYNLLFREVRRGPDVDPYNIRDSDLKTAISAWKFDGIISDNRYHSNDKIIDHRYIAAVTGGLSIRLYSDLPDAVFPLPAYKRLAYMADAKIMDESNIDERVMSVFDSSDPAVADPSPVLLENIRVFRSTLANSEALTVYDAACERLGEIKRLAISANRSYYAYLVKEMKTYDRIGGIAGIITREMIDLDSNNGRNTKLMRPLLDGFWYTNTKHGALSVISDIRGLCMYDPVKNTMNHVMRNPDLHRKIVNRIRVLFDFDIPKSSAIIIHIPYSEEDGNISLYVLEKDELSLFGRLKVGNMVFSNTLNCDDVFRTAILDPIHISSSSNATYFITSPGSAVRSIRTITPFRDFINGDVLFPVSVKGGIVSYTKVSRNDYSDFIITTNYATAKKLSCSTREKNGTYGNYLEFVNAEKSKFSSLL